jgi:hypothetical protein
MYFFLGFCYTSIVDVNAPREAYRPNIRGVDAAACNP